METSYVLEYDLLLSPETFPSIMPVLRRGNPNDGYRQYYYLSKATSREIPNQTHIRPG